MLTLLLGGAIAVVAWDDSPDSAGVGPTSRSKPQEPRAVDDTELERPAIRGERVRVGDAVADSGAVDVDARDTAGTAPSSSTETPSAGRTQAERDALRLEGSTRLEGYHEAIVEISRRGGAKAVASALDSWAELRADTDAPPSASALGFARATAHFAIRDYETAETLLLDAVLALEPSPGALANEVSPSSPWSMTSQLVPIISQRDRKTRTVASGATFLAMYMTGSRLVHSPDDRIRFLGWLKRLWRDELRPEYAMAASIWAHLLVHEGSLKMQGYAPALADEHDGFANDLSPPTREAVAELLQWSLCYHVVDRFAAAETADARRLLGIARTLCSD